LGEGQTERCECHPPGSSLEEFNAEDLLEVVQAARSRGLGHMHGGRSSDETAMLTERLDEHEVAQLEATVEELEFFHGVICLRARATISKLRLLVGLARSRE